MDRTKTWIGFVAVSVLFGVLLAGCAKKDEAATTPSPTTEPGTYGQTPAPATATDAPGAPAPTGDKTDMGTGTAVTTPPAPDAPKSADAPKTAVNESKAPEAKLQTTVLSVPGMT